MKNYFVKVQQIEQKNYASVECAEIGSNVLNCIDRHTVILHSCKTKKQAKELTKQFNDDYMKNGSYMY